MQSQTRYTLIKLPIREIIKQNNNLTMDRQTEIENGYLIAQGPSLLFDQIERLRGGFSEHIREVILVVAKKNPGQEPHLRLLLESGFMYNGTHYSRFGKSASQGKVGITAFVCDRIFEELFQITQMDIPIKECVISKYEAQRCLPFSSCTPIQGYMPNIIIVGEYEKILPNQFIKYVTESTKTFTDRETGKKKTYNARDIKEGYRDIKISPFDGCGCHEREFMETVSAQLGLDYNAVGCQIRLPFQKGYSVYVPFREICREWGITSITDIYGHSHSIDTIDCIWNVSMFKGHKLFLERYGTGAWTEYKKTLKKYHFKLGISKYSHHIKNLNQSTRMNFQYLQCLDLWNPKYIASYENGPGIPYDILDEENRGKIIDLAEYSTSLFEKIISGEKFYTYKFMGMTGTEDYETENRYLEAVLQNDRMLKDPAVKQFIYRKLKKSIEEAKVGKIYCSGLYHTGVGDMMGYLQYAAGLTPIGCLKERELYSGILDSGDCISFRSPLVDPSEVNGVKIVHNEITSKWFSLFQDQDIVMFNMYDISAPQQGGADFDGDIFFLCKEPVIIASKIDKPIIIDMEDKATAHPKSYTKENIIEYEIMTRDNRIGEITNAATSIENKYTTNPQIKKLYEDYASILRVMQGHEIDFIKTGTRWQMNKGLRKYLKQLPYFLLYNYPAQMKTYKRLQQKNKEMEKKEDRLALNAYHSPSPMNELCDYICTWEKRNILWNRSFQDLEDTGKLIIDDTLDLSDKRILRICRGHINDYAAELRKHMEQSVEQTKDGSHVFQKELLVQDFRERLEKELKLPEHWIANYVIKASYRNLSVSKALAWSAYGSHIIENLKRNSNPAKSVFIKEVTVKTETSYEYLGKHYEVEERDTDVQM